MFHQVYHFKYINFYKDLIKRNVPYIVIPHGCLADEAQKIKWLKKKIGNYLFFNSFINNAKAIQCLSKKELETTNFGKYKFIGTNGIKLPIKYKSNFNDNKIKFIYIGRLEIYHKGLDLMIKAFAINAVKLRKCNVILQIYGPFINSDSNKIKELINNNNISDLITLNDAITGFEKEIKLLDSDIFIQTSRFEGMPMGILEAMSYGLPCFVTRGTTLGELIEEYDAGWVCETNADSVAECIVRCINDKELFRQKGQNARKLIKDNFLWEKVSKNTIEQYKNIIGK